MAYATVAARGLSVAKSEHESNLIACLTALNRLDRTPDRYVA